MSLNPKITVRLRPDGERGLFATGRLQPHDVLLTYDGPRLDHPTRLSIQIDEHVHIDGTDESNAFVNHSCDPSAYVDWNALCLRARRPLSPGDEITCNYLTTDDELHTPFRCGCGSPACRGTIRGFRHLPEKDQRALEPWLPPFLKKRLHARG